jgi:biotin carboxyl carrier protein
MHSSLISWDGKCLKFNLMDEQEMAFFSEDDEGNTLMSIRGMQFKCRRTDLLNDSVDYGHGSEDESGGSLFAPMPGRVLKINVKEGDLVNRGAVLLVVEAMKMENNILASARARVDKISVKEGDMVDTKIQLVHLTEEE